LVNENKKKNPKRNPSLSSKDLNVAILFLLHLDSNHEFKNPTKH
jgi:hypothetical protein